MILGGIWRMRLRTGRGWARRAVGSILVAIAAACLVMMMMMGVWMIGEKGSKGFCMVQ